MTEPEELTAETVMRFGSCICQGHVPHTVPGEYMEIWECNGYVYAITLGERTCHPLGIRQ